MTTRPLRGPRRRHGRESRTRAYFSRPGSLGGAQEGVKVGLPAAMVPPSGSVLPFSAFRAQVFLFLILRSSWFLHLALEGVSTPLHYV